MNYPPNPLLNRRSLLKLAALAGGRLVSRIGQAQGGFPEPYLDLRKDAQLQG